MMTSQRQTSLFTEEQSTYSQEDSHANRIHQQVKDLVRKTIDISGRRCLEQFERYNPGTSWERMFMDSLIGMGDWFSTRCKLTWKMKGTKYNRVFFQLVPSTLPIEEIEFGLWPTPTSVQRDHPERVEKLKATGAKTMMSRAAGENRPNSVLDAAMFYGLIQTPTTIERAEPPEKMRERAEKNGYKNGTKYNSLKSQILYDPKIQKFLPTPNASDNRNRGNPNDPCIQKRIQNGKQVGLTMMVDGQLNPQFVAEMMGFPSNWTELPFLNGGKNQ